jgi:hypothetical protein
MIVGFPTETEHEAQASFAKVFEWKENDLVRQVVYNVFEISGGSDIASHPGDYGITEITSAPLMDLIPPITEFTCSGMDRKKAKSLCFDFIAELSRITAHSTNDQMNMFLTSIPGTVPHGVPTQYDMDMIQAAAEELYTIYDAKKVRFNIIPGFTFSKKRSS